MSKRRQINEAEMRARGWSLPERPASLDEQCSALEKKSCVELVEGEIRLTEEAMSQVPNDWHRYAQAAKALGK